MSSVNVAMIGTQFMGRAHSNAWRQVRAFCEPPVDPVMKVVCGRNPETTATAADRMGWQESATDWRAVIARDDIDVIDAIYVAHERARVRRDWIVHDDVKRERNGGGHGVTHRTQKRSSVDISSVLPATRESHRRAEV